MSKKKTCDIKLFTIRNKDDLFTFENNHSKKDEICLYSGAGGGQKRKFGRNRRKVQPGTPRPYLDTDFSSLDFLTMTFLHSAAKASCKN